MASPIPQGEIQCRGTSRPLQDHGGQGRPVGAALWVWVYTGKWGRMVWTRKGDYEVRAVTWRRESGAGSFAATRSSVAAFVTMIPATNDVIANRSTAFAPKKGEWT